MDTNYATIDDLTALTGQVQTLQGNVNTVTQNYAQLDQAVENINHLETLRDVSIVNLTEGDVLHYDVDGTWHNIKPSSLGISGGTGTGGGIDIDTLKEEGAKLFISKVTDDTAAGKITFQNGIVSDKSTVSKGKLQVGTFVTGLVGTGAQIDEFGNAEFQSVTVRDSLSVPELQFNKISVISGEEWNTVCHGEIESVNTTTKTITLKLEENEYSGISVDDICRGLVQNINDATETPEDQNGFVKDKYVATSYFKVKTVLDNFGKTFIYELQSESTPLPSKGMKFVVYGNFTKVERQNSAYSTRNYKRFLKNVNTWAITWQNIASHFGKLDGLVIPGAPNSGALEGDGAYLTNIYMTGATIKFTPEQIAELKGDTTFLHIAYADDAFGTNFSFDSGSRTWMGMYTDTIQTPSSDYLMYKWTQIGNQNPADGEDAIVYQLLPSQNVVKVINGVADPSTLSCSVVKITGASAVELLTALPATYTMDYTIDSNTSVDYTLNSSLSVPIDCHKITFKLKRNGAVIDSEGIPVLKDGESSIVVDLDNEHITFACYSDGSVKPFTPITIGIHVYRGLTSVPVTAIVPNFGAGVTVTTNAGNPGSMTIASATTVTEGMYAIAVSFEVDGYTITRNAYIRVTKVKDGVDGVNGKSFNVEGAPVVVRSSNGFLTVTECTLNSIRIADNGTTTAFTGNFGGYYRSSVDQNWLAIDLNQTNRSTGIFYWDAGLTTTEFWFGFSTAGAATPTSTNLLWSQRVPVVFDGANGTAEDLNYTLQRDRGYWDGVSTYYHDSALNSCSTEEYNLYQNAANLTIVDYVTYQGSVYYAKQNSTNQAPSLSSSYWAVYDKIPAMTVNNLLANNAKLGDFNFSNNIFSSSNSKLILDSETGQLYCTNAIISGNISTNKLIAKVTVENPSVPGTTIDYKISSVNENGDGAYIQYYPQGGGKRMELNAGNMIYYNDDGTVAWTLGASGDIVKATNNSYMWTDAVSLISECQSKTLPSNIPSHPGQIYTTLDYNAMYVRKADTDFVQYSYRVCVGTGTYAQYNGLAVKASAVTYGTTDPSTISTADYMPDGVYFELGGMQPMTSPLNSSIAGYARMARKVTDHKDPAQSGSAYLFWWEGTPDTTSVYYNDKVLIAKL